MNIQLQVCSLELSKKLKLLGVKQESLFYYQNNRYIGGAPCMDLMIKEEKGRNGENVIVNCEVENDENEKFPAFTVAELGEMLSKRYNEWSQGYHDCYSQWFFQVGNRGAGSMIDGIGQKGFSDQKNEANARAEMIIWLVENGYFIV